MKNDLDFFFPHPVKAKLVGISRELKGKLCQKQILFFQYHEKMLFIS